MCERQLRLLIHFFLKENLISNNSVGLNRSDTSRSELAELAKQANPDEIDIDDDDDNEDGDQWPDGECGYRSKTISFRHLSMHGCFVFCSSAFTTFYLSFFLFYRGAAWTEECPHSCLWRPERWLNLPFLCPSDFSSLNRPWFKAV